jgi:hypothetical protein
MAMMDWDNVGGYEVYPAGTYKVKINHFEHTTASTGTPQIKWSGFIMKPESLLNKPITCFTAITDAAMWRVGRLVKACGIKVTGKMDTQGPAFNNVLRLCQNRTTYWTLEEEADLNGKPRNNITDFATDPDQGTIEIKDMNFEDLPGFLKEEA